MTIMLERFAHFFCTKRNRYCLLGQNNIGIRFWISVFILFQKIWYWPSTDESEELGIQEQSKNSFRYHSSWNFSSLFVMFTIKEESWANGYVLIYIVLAIRVHFYKGIRDSHLNVEFKKQNIAKLILLMITNVFFCQLWMNMTTINL